MSPTDYHLDLAEGPSCKTLFDDGSTRFLWLHGKNREERCRFYASNARDIVHPLNIVATWARWSLKGCSCKELRPFCFLGVDSCWGVLEIVTSLMRGRQLLTVGVWTWYWFTVKLSLAPWKHVEATAPTESYSCLIWEGIAFWRFTKDMFLSCRWPSA